MSVRRHRFLPVAIAAACIVSANGAEQQPGATGELQGQVPVMQQLSAAKASQKVAAVLWTRRTDRYTLQIVFPRSVTMSSATYPVVTFWLLRGDGTTIPVMKESPFGGDGSRPLELLYSVPLAAGDKAVAAALRIDNQYFIEALQNLNE